MIDSISCVADRLLKSLVRGLDRLMEWCRKPSTKDNLVVLRRVRPSIAYLL